MNKLRLFILLGLLTCSYQNTFSQVFAHPGATWVFHQPSIFGMCSNWYDISEYKGDTLILGVNAKRVEVTQKIQYLVPPYSWTTYIFDRFFEVSGDTVTIF